MSSRNFRKLCGNSLPPPDSDDSDGDYDPIPNRHFPTYEGLEVSDTDSEREPEADDSSSSQDAQNAASNAAYGGARKKNQKKGKGKGKKSKSAGDAATGLPLASTSATGSARRAMPNQEEELDEIDKSIMEVNALLGEPPPAPLSPEKEEAFDEGNIILEVKAKHLNVTTELRRLFGPDDPEEVRQRNKSQPHRIRILKRVMVGPTLDTPIYDFKKIGLSMSIEKREQGVVHFVYDHDLDHQKMHRAFLVTFVQNFMRQGTPMFNMDNAKKNMHVEPLLEIADTLFRMEENSLANEIIENVVTYLQFVAHPSFNLASRNVRLSYNYLENRPFHVSMLKYMYLLTNKACHRTALEIAKMLLNIDPCDPLAVLFVIDTLALRAREHQWLIDAIEYFDKQRQAKMLFNIQYSFALAHFHVARKSKTDFAEADKNLQSAIMSYPRVVYRVLEFASVNEPEILKHTVFTTEPQTHSGEGLSELMMIYAKLTWSRWREPQVLQWFIRNAKEVIEKYDKSQDVRGRVRELAMLRHNIFQVWPTEIMRHITVIASMSNLLLEMTLSPTVGPTSGWDPLFDRGVNRYTYRSPSDPPRTLATGGRALLYSYQAWDEHTLFMAHFIGTRGRTHHSSAFDPWLGYLMPHTRRGPAPNPTPPRGGTPDSPRLTDYEEDSSSAGEISPTPSESALERFRGNAFRLHHFEALFDTYRQNGSIPDRLYHPNITAYAINFLNMFHELIINRTPTETVNRSTETVHRSTETDDSSEESELEDFLYNPPPESEDDQENIQVNHNGNNHVNGRVNEDEYEHVNDHVNDENNEIVNDHDNEHVNNEEYVNEHVNNDEEEDMNEHLNDDDDEDMNAYVSDDEDDDDDDHVSDDDNEDLNVQVSDDEDDDENDDVSDHGNYDEDEYMNDHVNNDDYEYANNIESESDDEDEHVNDHVDDEENGYENEDENNIQNDYENRLLNGYPDDIDPADEQDNDNHIEYDHVNEQVQVNDNDNNQENDNGRVGNIDNDHVNDTENDQVNDTENDQVNNTENDQINNHALEDVNDTYDDHDNETKHSAE